MRQPVEIEDINFASAYRRDVIPVAYPLAIITELELNRILTGEILYEISCHSHCRYLQIS